MDDDDDDFTFPTVIAAARGPTTAPEGQLGRVGDDAVPHLLHIAAASPLWPFAGSAVPKTTTATTMTTPSSSTPPPVTADGEQAPSVPVSGSSSGRALCSAVAEEEEGHRVRVAADEERMDLLWEGTPTTCTRSIATAPAPEPRSVAGLHAGPPPPKQRGAADVDDDKQRAASLADAERMDKLWESFNEDLVLRQRQRRRDRARRAKSASGTNSRVVPRAAAATGGPDDDDPAADDNDRWYLCDYSPSSDDDESSDGQETSASSPAEQRRGYGCAPTMLRASSRAGGAGQFCAAGSSPRARRRRRGQGAAAGWALLLRLFRRLFAVDKTAPSTSPSSRGHSSLYVP